VDGATAKSVVQNLHGAQNPMYAGGDPEAVRALLAEDFVWHVPGNNAIAGVYRGRDEVLAYFRRRRRIAGNTMRLHPGEIMVGQGDYVAALTEGAATLGGAEYRWGTVGLYRIRDGLIAACWLLPLDPEALDRVWSAAAQSGD
jgi:ketosteroid isomerase-like protein